VTLRYAAFYGSLRQAIYDPAAPRIAGRARFVGPCTLWGRLVDHDPYPGFFPARDGGPVAADLLEILDPDAFFAAFDAWEYYDPAAPERSDYLRRPLALHAPGGQAWVYVSNQSPDDPAVPHGDWRRYVIEARRT
jgi:gamma-glutamylcyclotransferase (GGCT)/AIG2-like uncharacterized protein YtfP